MPAATAHHAPFIPRADGSGDRFGRRRLMEVIAALALAAVVVAAVGGAILYRAFIDGQKDRLLQLALGMGQTIEAVARFDSIFSQNAHPKGAAAATLSQAFDGIKSIVAHDGRIEFVIARREGEGFALLLSQIHESTFFDVDGQALPASSPFAPVLRRAYGGPPGTAIVTDPIGGHPERLAGFTRIGVLDLALMVMIDTAEVVAPFRRALPASLAAALLAVGLGALFIRRSLLKVLGRLSATIDSLSQAQRMAHLGNWEWDVA
ncbi:MAG: hypothetical protein FJX42_11710, partial [Alphaproteobacteria bacterium]|nr:hypothetical protein [Alphaproteobacteria bacterium]